MPENSERPEPRRFSPPAFSEKPVDDDLAKISSESFLFAIDCSASMDQGEPSLLSLVFQTVADSMRALAIHNRADTINLGLLFYNTTESNVTFKPLSLPTPLDVKKLIRLGERPQFRKDAVHCGQRSPEAFINMLNTAKAQVTGIHDRSLFRLIIITNDDDPVDGSAKLLNIAQTSMSDLGDLRVLTLPVFLDLDGLFKPTKFWSKLTYMPANMTEFEYRAGSVTLSSEPAGDILSSLRRLIGGAMRQPHAYIGTLRLGAMDIGIRSSSIYPNRPVKLFPVKLAVYEKNGETITEVLANQYAFLDKDTGKVLKDSEVARADENTETAVDNYGDENNVYEMLRFVPREVCVAAHLRCGSSGVSKLLVPSNLRIEKSSRAFASLHRSMRQRNVGALMRLSRIHGPPVLGLLYAFDPSKPSPGPAFDQKEDAYIACGMFFVPLPFSDDIRDLETKAATKSEIKAESKPGDLESGLASVIQKMNIKHFNPEKFPSPMRAQNERVLECQVLGLDLQVDSDESGVYEMPDATTPRYGSMVKFLGNTVTSLAHNFHLNTRYADRVSNQAKRIKTE